MQLEGSEAMAGRRWKLGFISGEEERWLSIGEEGSCSMVGKLGGSGGCLKLYSPPQLTSGKAAARLQQLWQLQT